jgi:hypothetical protein
MGISVFPGFFAHIDILAPFGSLSVKILAI